jgi:hypothetical protein
MRLLSLTFTVVLLISGCTKETTSTPMHAGIARQANEQRITAIDITGEPVIPKGADNRDANPDSLTDPCAARLHDIGGAMLLYYVLHHKMPEKLEDVVPLADAGQSLPLTCARSGQPFQYFPDGLAAPQKEKRIVVFDPTPMGAKKYRWCLMVSPSKPGSIAVDVIPLAESVFNLYKPVTQ